LQNNRMPSVLKVLNSVITADTGISPKTAAFKKASPQTLTSPSSLESRNSLDVPG